MPFIFSYIIEVAGGELISEFSGTLTTTNEDIGTLEDCNAREASRIDRGFHHGPKRLATRKI